MSPATERERGSIQTKPRVSLKGAYRIRACHREIKRICVTKLRYIGDTLLITPVLDALNEAFPHASITAVVARGTEQVLYNNPAVDDVISIDRTAPMLKYLCGLRLIRRKRFDLAIDLTGAERSAFLVRWSGAPIRMGYRRRSVLSNHVFYNALVEADEGRLHRVDHHLAMIEAMGIPIPVRVPKLFLTDEEMAATAESLGRNGVRQDEPFIIFHPGARRWYKSWPLEYFSQLGDRVTRELNIPVVLAGGASDRESVQIIQQGMTTSCINMAAQMNLRELSGLLKMASVCVVNDSGPMHMAAAVGTPTVSFFGLTDPKLWAPRGPDHRVFSRDCPCRSYGHRRECPEGENRCMRKISVVEVFEAIKTMLTEHERGH